MVTIVETKSRCRSKPRPAAEILFKPPIQRNLSAAGSFLAGKEAVIPIVPSQLRSAEPHAYAARRASSAAASRVRDTALAARHACVKPATAEGLRRRPTYP